MAFVCGQKSCVSSEQMYIIVEWGPKIIGVCGGTFVVWFEGELGQDGAGELTGVLFIKGGGKGLLVA